MEVKVRKMEMRMEMKKREERKRNILIRGVEGNGKDIEKRIWEILKDLGVEKGVQETKFRRGRREGEKGMAIVRLRKVESMIEIMRKRRDLTDKKVRIDDDLTWKERRIRWRLEDIARRERGKGERVRVGYGKLLIEERWWRWVEEEERLKDTEGRIWGAGRRARGSGKNVELGRREGERMEERKRGWRVAFWNVAGLQCKNRDFWQRIREWDVIILIETWVEEKRLKEKLVIEEEEVDKEEGRMSWRIRIEGENWRIIGIYVNKDIERKLEGLNGWR